MANKRDLSFETKEKDSVALALLSADLVSAALFTIYTYVTDSSGVQSPAYFGLLVLVGVSYSAVPITILALPLFLVWRRTGLFNLWSTLLSGIIIGCITARVLERPKNGVSSLLRFDWSDHAVRIMAVFGAIGGISAISFWLVWTYRQRNSTVPSA